MATEELEVIISSTGDVSITAKGFSGTSCLSATAGLEDLLGGEIAERRMTEEAYRSQTQQDSQQLNIGETPRW